MNEPTPLALRSPSRRSPVVRWWARTPSPGRELLVVSTAAWFALLPHLLWAGPGAAPDPTEAGAGAWIAGVAVTAVAFTVMATAMVLPPARPAAAYVARASLPARRGRGVTLFCVGAVVAWLPFSVIAATWHEEVGTAAPVVVAAGAFGVAAWMVAPARRRRLRRCLRSQPIRAHGRAADRSALGYGVSVGGRCLVICAPAMAVVVVAGHPPALVLWMAASAGAERSLAVGERLARWLALGWLAVAALALLWR